MGFCKELGCLLLSLLLLWIGIAIFANGFLLTRHEISRKSSCHKSSNGTCYVATGANRVHSKAIVLIIDALRFDFAWYNDTPADLPYINKLKIFRELAEEKGCASARLFRFQADAPTTTMQRIKGFTTGSFPTFVDISNNFDSAEISEDNIIDQLVAKGTNVTLLGDDTWMNLFPGRFKTALPFPSFDVKDLHTVDNGIMQHIHKEINKKDWGLIIAHFLGVDHCGHRYSPVHHEMTAKLNQVNDWIKSVVHSMSNDTLLIVMGDHGMTETGDHGGATSDEVDTTLFVYSPTGSLMTEPQRTYNKNCYDSKIQQVDIVPTLSFLLESPIPFSNLGSFIGALSPGKSHSEQQSNLKKALSLNLRQVLTYLREYQETHKSFPQEEYDSITQQLQDLAGRALRDQDMVSAGKLLRKCREMCRGIWARFDEALMAVGLLLCSVFVALSFKLAQPKSLGLVAAFTVLIFLAQNDKETAGRLISLGAVAFALAGFWRSASRRSENAFPKSLLACFLVAYAGLYTSNSLILNEDRAMSYLFISALLLLLIVLARSLDPPKGRTQRTAKSLKRRVAQLWARIAVPGSGACLLCTCLAVLVRAAFVFRKCRPEQFWCFNQTEQENPLRLLQRTSPAASLVVSALSLVGLLLVTVQWFARNGNARALLAPSRICARNILPLAALCMALNWLLQLSDPRLLDSLPDAYVTVLPRCAFALLLVSATWWIVSPVTAHLVYPDSRGRYVDNPDQKFEDQVISSFHQLRQQLGKNSGSKASSNGNQYQHRPPAALPAAFGLYTVGSAAFIGLGEVAVLFALLLLEAEYALLMLCYVIATYLLLELIAIAKHRIGDPDVTEASWPSVALWSISTSFWWFATGHQGAISGIPWNAAFVGFRGSHPTVVLPALMVTSHIYASQILHTVLLPLLLFWPITRGRVTSREKGGAYESELHFIQSETFIPAMRDLFTKHITMQTLKALGCMVASFIHRRHLMVWWIFAPRFLYEIAAVLVVCLFSIGSFCFAARLRAKLLAWVDFHSSKNSGQ